MEKTNQLIKLQRERLKVSVLPELDYSVTLMKDSVRYLKHFKFSVCQVCERPSSFPDMVFDVIYQTQGRVFHQISKH